MSIRDLLKNIASNWVRARQEKFTNHPIALLIRNDLKNEVQNLLAPLDKKYIVKASAGAGNWANIPWLSILDPTITQTTQSGVYPVYLFRADGSGIYLSLGFGSTDLVGNNGRSVAKAEALKLKQYLRSNIPNLDSWNSAIDLKATTDLGASYEWASAGAKFYSLENMPDEKELHKDLADLISIYDDAKHLLNTSGLREVSKMISLSKPFILLAGISGTGKTRFVRKQAEKGDSEKCYELVSVRPDWHEPSDLLGYISRLSGTPQYVVTDVLRFVALAWTKIVDARLDLSVVRSNGHEQIAVTGKLPSLESLGPQWLCLDEMNLAPVEQYFADYLSVLETREWQWDGDSFTYKSDALLKPGIFKELSAGSLSVLKNDLGFSEEYSDLWDFVTAHGLGVPPQLIVAGTVNMDETTHGFSRKVIDRALTFDFGEFYPNVLSEIFEPTTTNKTLSYPIHSQAQREYLPAIDSGGTLSIEFIEKINVVLDNTPFKLAYRAMNELLLSLICYQPNDQLELKAVWDDFLMCKVLPRIEGDTDKLAGKGAQQLSLLDDLTNLLETEFNEFWNASGADDSARPDLLRVSNDAKAPVIRIGCRSRKKLEWMQSRLTTSGFTSFWP